MVQIWISFSPQGGEDMEPDAGSAVAALIERYEVVISDESAVMECPVGNVAAFAAEIKTYDARLDVHLFEGDLL